MVLSDAEIISFQKIYKNRFGIDLSKEDAYEKGISLLHLISIVYKPMTEKELQLVEKRRAETKI
jgi:hypothetical protein